jgi:methyl-accepting chemotaxis protein
LAQIEKRNGISTEWTKAVEAALKSSSLAHAIGTTDLENFLYQADARVSTLRALAWRFGVTGENLSESISRTNTALNEVFKEARLKSGENEFMDLIARLESIVKRFLATNEAVIKGEAEKEDIVQNRSVKFVNEAGSVIEAAVSSARASNAGSKDQAAAETAYANRISLLMSLAVIASIIGSVLFSFFGVGRPMTRLNGALGRMAAGELNIKIPGADRGDEIGDLAKTVVVIGENAAQKARQEAEAKASEDELHARHRKAEMVKLADSFEGAVGEIVQTVSAASIELETAAGTLTTTADRSQELTLAVASASEQASANVQSVASASEELSSSVREISRQVQESARMATGAVDQARATNDRVSELSKAAGRIGDVVALINTIAEQTNLLALNATIEAARAGDAGRGFAVVASEVKALAEQTSKATGEIGQQITGIQAATEESVGAIREISGTIERLAEVSSAIAAAVEEQGAATQEIARNVQQASRGTQQVSANISDVRRGTEETGSASTKVLSAAQLLSKDSGRLKAQVTRFLESIRAA